MNKLTYGEIQALTSASSVEGLPVLKVAILRNIMLEPIEAYWKYHALEMGCNAQIRFGEYDDIAREACSSASDLLQDCDYVLIFARLENLSPNLAGNFSEMTASEVGTEIDAIKDFAKMVVAGIRKHTNATVLWHGLEAPIYPSLGILDCQIPTGQSATIATLNDFFKEVLRADGNGYFVDLNLCLARLGEKKFYDRRYWHIGRAPFTREAMAEIAREDFKFIRSLNGKSKKCLVLDCDNVLWGGVVGEIGISDIKLGKSYPGSSYYEFQQEVLNLYNRGIILVLCSKNNPEDVWEVFRQHPDMLIKEKHIATAQINWEDKVSNLRRIAADLNIGLDSLVLADDSEFEVHMVRKLLPDVSVIHLPTEKAVEFKDILASCGLFDSVAISDEDKRRGAMYKAETARKQLRSQVADLQSYYQSLEMALVVRFVTDLEVPRIAQLTQKTNQFNLTAKKYTECDIAALLKSQSHDVISVKVQDRFGDSGVVGVCILKYGDDKRADFDTFLLSCRVLGRGVEDGFMAQCLKLAKVRGNKVAIGYYVATAKNSQGRDFYLRHGFKLTKEQDHARAFKIELDGELPQVPAWFKVDSEIMR